MKLALVLVLITVTMAGAFDGPQVTLGLRTGADYRFTLDGPFSLDGTGKSSPELVIRGVWPWGMVLMFEHCGSGLAQASVQVVDKVTVWDTEFKKNTTLDLDSRTTVNRAEVAYNLVPGWWMAAVCSLDHWNHSARLHGYHANQGVTGGGGQQDVEAVRSFGRLIPGMGLTIGQPLGGGLLRGKAIAYKGGFGIDAGYMIPVWFNVIGAVGYRARELAIGDIGKIKISGAYVEFSVGF
jgi:hypothetical protein